MKKVTESLIVTVVAAVVMVGVATLMVMAVNKVLKLDDASGVSSGDATIAAKENRAWFDGDKMLETWQAWLDKMKGKTKTETKAEQVSAEQRSAQQAQSSMRASMKVRDDEKVAALPNIESRGNVRSLRQVMKEDSTGKLQRLVTQFISKKTPAAREALVDDIIFAWTGADKYASNSRGPYMDGRMVYALEALLAKEFKQEDGDVNPYPSAVKGLREAYESLSDYVYATLLMQTHLQPYMALIDKDYKQHISLQDPNKTPEFSELIKKLQLDYAKNKDTTIQLAKDIRFTLKYGSTDLEKSDFVLKRLPDAVSLISDKALVAFKKDMYAAFKGKE